MLTKTAIDDKSCEFDGKNILVILYSYFPYEDANTNVFLPIIQKFREFGANVDVLTCDYRNCCREIEVLDDVTIYRFKRDWCLMFGHLLAKYQTYLKMHPNSYSDDNKITQVPMFDSKRMLVNCLAFLMRNSHLQKVLTHIVKKKEYTFVIAVTSPIYTQIPVVNLYNLNILSHTSTKYISYFMDPWASYVGFTPFYTEYISLESTIYDSADLVIVTPEMYLQNNLINKLNKFIEKTVPLELCCLQNIDSSVGGFDGYDSAKINCLFCGSLQDLSVRDPTFLFKLIRECNDERVVFHLVINNFSRSCKKLFRLYLKDKTNYVLYSRLPLSVCHAMMYQADVCINIGNICNNQLPSKIFDYMGAGTPIVNLYSIPEDTTRPILYNYPLALNLCESSQIEEIVGEFLQFCSATHGHRVSQDFVQVNYNKYLGSVVASKFINLLLELLNKNIATKDPL